MSAQNVRKVVRIEAKPGLADQTRAALIELQQATVLEPGCCEFRFFQALTEPSSFLLVEDFISKAALEEHLQLPHTRNFFSKQLTAEITPIDAAWLA